MTGWSGVRTGVAVLAAAALLTGCSSVKTFTADVRNSAGQPVQAKLFEPREGGRTTDEKRIPPGDRDSFSLRSSSKRVTLQVDVIGNAGVPQRVEVGPGQSIVKVEDTDASSSTRINLSVTENY
ncbi:MAG: hypothetical protein AAF108_10620 [Planctomycetota bacterium]